MSKVEIIENFLSKEELNHVLTLYNKTEFSVGPCVVDNKNVYIYNHRNCKQGVITENINDIIEKIIPLHKKYAEEELDIPVKELKTEYQLVPFKYEEGEFFHWHPDWADDDQNRTRRITSVIQLSYPTEYEGGLLEFENSEIVGKKTPGTLIIFNSKDIHRVSIVTKGTRRSCSIFSHWIKE